MKILVFCPYYPPHTGGLETHSDEFNKSLALNGVEVIVFTPNIPNVENVEEMRFNRVHIIRYPAFEIISNYPVPKFWHPTFWKSLHSLFRSDFDIVISRTRFFLSSLIALFYAKTTGTKWIHIEHGSDFVKLSSSFKTIVARVYDSLIGRLIFRSSDLNISISHAVQKFVALFDKRPSPIIYRGLDFEGIDTVMPDTTFQKKYAGKIILATAARLYKWKGIDTTLASIRELPEEIRSQIVFLIIGNGEDYQRLQTLGESLPIELLGNLPRERVMSILKATDIYIHSSLPGGGLSTSLLEAMYCECAVIATPNEGADEIVEHNKNGILIESSSAEEIGIAIKELVLNPMKRKTFSDSAKRNVRERFSWDSSIGKYLEIFQTILK